MVAIAQIRQANTRVNELSEELVALFLGATSGVGRSALEQFVAGTVRPRVYIAARKSSPAAELVNRLRESNPQGTYNILEKDVSLVHDVDQIVEHVKSHEKKLDLLVMSMGFNSFMGRQETTEGLDSSMSTRYYSRAAALQGVLPLLKAAPQPRVVSVLAGGLEGKMNEEDLDLRKPGNFGLPAAAVHSATMMTLSMEHFARENPDISFVHAFPGPVATDNFTKGSTGILGLVLRWVVTPALPWIFAGPDDVGARVIFYATNDRYSVKGKSVPMPEGVSPAARSEGGVFLVNAQSENAGDEKILGDMRRRKVDEQVWAHTQSIFDSIRAKQ